MHEARQYTEQTTGSKVNTVHRTIEANGVTIRVVEASPAQPVKEGDVRNRVLFSVGWGTNENTYESLQQELAVDREVISLGHPRRGGDYSTERGEATSSMPEVEWIKAQNLLAYIKDRSVTEGKDAIHSKDSKFDLFCHSEGAINGIIAACENPEAIGNIVLFGPAGLQGDDKVLSLMLRFGKKMAEEQDQAKKERADVLTKRYSKLPSNIMPIEPGELTSGGVEASWEEPSAVKATIQEASVGTIKYLLGNVKRAIQEGRAIAETDIRGMLEYVQSRDIKVVVVQGVDDKAIPMGRVSSTLAEGMSKSKLEKDAGLNKYINGFVSVPMLHDDPIQQARALAPALRGIFDTLSNPPKRQRVR